MEIKDMKLLSPAQIEAAAVILSTELGIGWPTVEDARQELNDRLFVEDGNVFLAAIEGDEIMGFVGGLPVYGGNVWELHPLVVSRKYQKRGLGAVLMAAIEDAARDAGGLTMWLGADDESEPTKTSLGCVDLYDDTPAHIAGFEPGTHQTGFYLRMGYTITGVMPDANGIGKPDIFMAKRLFYR